ncbi:MAG: dephospho-CoA kinase [Crocinitomicaceae bacterium]
MRKVGITGGIGSGKSMVGRVLESMGFPVFYSDDEAKRLSDKDPIIRSELIAVFGDEVYTKEGLNRPFLAEKIFGNETLRHKVNAIIHPRVREAFNAFAIAQKSPFVFNEAAILIETGVHENFDFMILVTAPEDVRIDRVKQRDNTDREVIQARMNKQWSDDQKRPFADFEIVNDGQTPLVRQIENVIEKLKEL